MTSSLLSVPSSIPKRFRKKSGPCRESTWAYCDSCHNRFLEYQKVLSKVIPVMASVAAADFDNTAAESGASMEAAERALIQRGIVVSRRPRGQKGCVAGRRTSGSVLHALPGDAHKNLSSFATCIPGFQDPMPPARYGACRILDQSCWRSSGCAGMASLRSRAQSPKCASCACFLAARGLRLSTRTASTAEARQRRRQP
jgi:hypothetical protein